jgi:hypothetical protein
VNEGRGRLKSPRNHASSVTLPIFIAQHATATCCRGCLEKWHRIPRGQPLTQQQIKYVLSVVVRWLSAGGFGRDLPS